MEQSNRPFHQWVPRPVGTLVLLMMFVPPTFSGGAYLCNAGEMAGSTSLWAEDIQLASFFTSIGMCLFPPFMVRFLQARRIKRTYLCCFALLAVLNYVCATATSLPLLLTACLLTGFVRIIAMLNCTFTIAPYLTGMDTLVMFTMKEMPGPEVQYALERKRTFLMPVLYSFILLISQASNMLLAWAAYAYRWQDAYFVVILMLVVAMLLVVCTMADEESHLKYEPEWGKVPDMLLMGTALCALAFVLVYGKTLDWWHSAAIRWGTGVALMAGGAFLFCALRTTEREKYLPLEAFSYRNVWMSMLMFVGCMVLNSANALVSTFAKLTTPVSNHQSATLSGWAMVGCLIGLVLSVGMIVRKVRFRTIFCTAFLLMAAANASMYFQYQTTGMFSRLPLPMVLNFAGLLMVYSVAAAFGMKRLPPHLLATYVFLIIWMRNAIAPVIGTSIYANWLNHRQQYYIGRLAQTVDSGNALASTAFMQTRRAALASGKGTLEAEEMATTAVKGRIVVQATIVAMKDVTGSTVLMLTGAAALVLLLPYHRRETT